MILSLALLKRLANVLPQPARSHTLEAVRVGWEMAHLVRPGRTAFRLAFRPRRRIVTYPDAPSRYQVLFKLAAYNGFRIVTDPGDRHDLAFHFQYHARPCELPRSTPTVNRNCGDVSKQRVAQTFADTFGYALAVDPLTFQGLLVEKPDSNHTFEGRVLQGPLRREDIKSDRVYERYIDTVADGEAVDLRTPIYGREIPVVYEKRRPKDVGLKDVRSAKIRSPGAVFSPQEQALLVQFAGAIGLDYGELDVLRDVKDQRIYVVDVNNTPAGPPKQMTSAEIAAALDLLSPSFNRMLDHVIEREGAWRGA